MIPVHIIQSLFKLNLSGDNYYCVYYNFFRVVTSIIEQARKQRIMQTK